MRSPKWLVVARNEYRIKTSRMRKIRPFFPILVVGILAVYLGFVAPQIVNLLIDDFLESIIAQLAVPLVQIIMFMVFFYFIIIPISNTLREAQTEQLEIFLAAPVKASDVLLGEFLGAMPFYSIAATIIAGTFMAFLAPLGLDSFQVAVMIGVFVLTFFSALWIGSVVAAILRTRLGKTARGKDVGRALALIVALPGVALMYAVIGGGLAQTLTSSATGSVLRTVLSLLPSSWGAEVFVSFASNPGNIGVAAVETLTRFGGLIVFTVVILGLGVKAADTAYSLETAAFTASRVKADGTFYRIIRFLGGGGSFATLLISIFKDYSRRLENLSRIFYILGLLIIINVFLVEPGDTNGSIVITAFILPLLSAFVVGEVTLRGKESLFVFKKAPSGIGRLVRARLLKGWVVVVPISVVVSTIVMLLNPKTHPAFLLVYTGLVALIVAATVAFVLGLFLLNPAFSDKSGNYIVNTMIAMQALPIGTFLIPLIAFDRLLGLGLQEIMFFFTVPLNWTVGLLLLYLGKRRLGRIE